MVSVEKVTEKLSPLERKIIPFLNLPIKDIKEKTKLDNTSLLRALKFLENKEILKVTIEKKKVIELGTNGIYYKKHHLPERTLISLLEKKNYMQIDEAKLASKLSDNEFKVSLGVLKSKAIIDVKNGKISLNASKEELSKKTLEEQFLDALPLEEILLEPEQKFAFENLKKRKDIVESQERNLVSFELTEVGKQLAGKEIKTDLLEEVTPELIKNWKKNKKFREYDIQSEVPRLHGGKKHFVTQSIERGKRIWLDMGFKEMSGNMIQTSFWNFDALFTAQDHPVREMQDTFFIKDAEGKLPEKELVDKIKKAHESGVDGSKGWGYSWNEEEAKKVVLRTHTTCLSAHTLAKLKKEEMPAKFFVISKNFRNETVDWSHGFEFNQSDGIVVDPNANLRHLMGYLKEFAKKMGFEKIRIQPAYFPYTEPSLEGAVWNEEKQEWVEVLAAGIFRPEVTAPLLGKAIPVLAWGPGFDRLMILANNIKDLRQVYENDIQSLRDKKVVVK
jgi:phenylalanyl-tRNA synthetase alpha chain